MTQKLKLVSDKQQTGKYYEDKACEYLIAQGLQYVCANWLQPKVGELDLVMVERGKAWDTLVFVEVRVRSNKKFGDGLTSVTKSKQQKLIKTAQYFLQSHSQYQNYPCRFDVISFVDGQATQSQPIESTQPIQPIWIQDAFIASGW